MPRAIWSDLDESELDDHSQDNLNEPYDGEQPPRGVYTFDLVRMAINASRQGNPSIELTLRLVPTRTAQKQYEGFVIRAWIPAVKETMWRVRPLLRAIGVSGRDFVRSMILGEPLDTDVDFPTGLVLKIGTKKITEKVRVRALIGKEKGREDSEYLSVLQFYPPKTAVSTDLEDEEADRAPESQPTAGAGKKGKGKKGKAASEPTDDEEPF